MKTIFTRLRVLGLCLWMASQTHLLTALPTTDPICHTNVLLKQSEGAGGDCPEEPILVINPAGLNGPFGQDLLITIQPGNYRIRLNKDENGFTMPIQPGKYTVTTSAIGISNCEATVQEIEIVHLPTLYDIQFTQYDFGCEEQASYKVGISPAFDRETFGIPMTITLLSSGQIFEVTANSNAFLLSLPAGQYQLISASPSDPNCQRVQHVEVRGSNGTDDQAPIFTSTFCDTYYCSTTPACFSEIHYLVEAIDNCGPVTITNSFNNQSGSSFADVFPLGTHEIVFTATDAAGNQSNCTVNFSLSYEGEANAFCVADAIVTVGAESKRYLTIDELAITNPSGAFCEEVYTIDPPYVSCEDVGIQTVKVFQKGNDTPLCETNITVEPQFEFVLNCSESTHSANENRNGECGAEVKVEIEVEHAGCPQNITIRNDYNTAEGSHFTEFFPVGRHEVTFYLEQNAALVTTCTKTIVVQEDPTGLACFQACLPEAGRVGSSSVFNAAQESWELGSQENALLAQADDITFISIPMTGDGSIVAEINQMSPTARAGVMMRESCDPGSRFIAALLKPFSRNAYQRHRSEAYAPSQQLQKRLTGGYPKWVKLKRQGNRFYSYASRNGYSWKLLFKTTLLMEEQMQWGLMVESSTVNTHALASFENIRIYREATDRMVNRSPYSGSTSVETQQHQLKSSPQTETEFTVFPNPTQGHVSINLPDWKEYAGTLEVLDMNGRSVWKRKVEWRDGRIKQFDWHMLQAGTYLVVLQRKGQIPSMQRVVIQPR